MSEMEYQLFTDEGEAHQFLSSPNSSRNRVQNLDKFLLKVYNYFLGKGFFNMLIAKLLNLLSILWVISFTTFLLTCVDYQLLFSEIKSQEVVLSDVVRYDGLQPSVIACLIIFCSFWLWTFFQFVVEVRDNWEIKSFYQHELHIPEDEIATIEWREIVNRLVKVPRLCILKEEMTPLDVANRIMRKDNYLIAMINKDLLHLYIPLPGMRGRSFVTKTIEWGLSYSIFSFVFDQNNSINKQILDPSKSAELAKGLRNRFKLMGLAGLILSPFIFVFLLIYFVFQYGEQLHNRPSAFAMRQWSPLAAWKFRELNELPHVFQIRLKKSRVAAEKYVTSFPMNSVAVIARFISFIVGSLVAVLLLLSIRDENALFQLEIWPERSAIWFVGIGGTIIAGCRSLIPDENAIMEPTKAMDELYEFTHYMPNSWNGKTHTTRVLGEFTQLYEYRIVIFAFEIMSVLFAPFILLFSLPNSAEKVIEFFRVFTVHEPGVGDVCKFATFQLEENGNKKYGAVVESDVSKKMRTKQGKLEKSFLNFKANYPEWKPAKGGEKYLNKVSQTMSQLNEEDDGRSSPNESMLYTRSDPDVFSNAEKPTAQESIASLSRIHRIFFKAKPSSLSDSSRNSMY